MTDAKSRLAELLARVSTGERFAIQRRAGAVAVLIDPNELEQLERASLTIHRLASVLGQDEDLLAAVVHGEVHPAMAAFGVWRNAAEFDDLAERIAANRTDQPSRTLAEL